MTKLLDLVNSVKRLTLAHADAKNKIVDLKGVIASRDDTIKVMIAQAEADDATIAELMSLIDGVVGNGGSMGGVAE